MKPTQSNTHNKWNEMNRKHGVFTCVLSPIFTFLMSFDYTIFVRATFLTFIIEMNRVQSRIRNLLFISVLFQSEKDTEDQCDEPPTDLSTILTAMEDVEQIAKDAGQKHTVFTSDQQLYAIVLNIASCNPKRWEYFIPRLGGMHWLVSFIGTCGSLMKGSGLHQYISAFAGVSKMLIGKKVPYEYEGT